jgi:hypothetical protein
VVNTSSSTHMFSNMDLNTFKDGPARKKAGPQKLYSQSKHVRAVYFIHVQICLIYWSGDRVLSCGRRSLHDDMVTKGLSPQP